MSLRLSRLNQALATWDAVDAGVVPPGGAQRPELDRRALRTSLVMLIGDMSRLEQELCAHHDAASLN
ncbi:MAG: hypothetical protein ACRDHX_05170 [Chloroflexota bacterium]